MFFPQQAGRQNLHDEKYAEDGVARHVLLDRIRIFFNLVITGGNLFEADPQAASPIQTAISLHLLDKNIPNLPDEPCLLDWHFICDRSKLGFDLTRGLGIGRSLLDETLHRALNRG